MKLTVDKIRQSNMSNTLLWLSLVVLAVLNFYLSEITAIDSSFMLAIILSAVIIKFIGVGFQYMELRHSHRLWKYMFISFILLFAFILWMVS